MEYEELLEILACKVDINKKSEEKKAIPLQCNVIGYSGDTIIKYDHGLVVEQTSKDQISDQINRNNFANLNINAGNQKYNAKQYQEAVILYELALKSNPDSSIAAAAHNNIGLSQQNLDQLVNAIAKFDTAIQLNPVFEDYKTNKRKAEQEKLAVENYNIGTEKNSMGQYQEAISHFNKAIELKPGYSFAYTNRGCAKQSLGNLEEALQDYTLAAQYDPNNTIAQNNKKSVQTTLEQRILNSRPVPYSTSTSTTPNNLTEDQKARFAGIAAAVGGGFLMISYLYTQGSGIHPLTYLGIMAAVVGVAYFAITKK